MEGACHTARMDDDDSASGHWGFRVVRRTFPSHVTGTGQPEDSLVVAEVYYGTDGSITTWAEAQPPGGEALDDVRDELERMSDALDLPVIDEADLPGGEQ